MTVFTGSLVGSVEVVAGVTDGVAVIGVFGIAVGVVVLISSTADAIGVGVATGGVAGVTVGSLLVTTGVELGVVGALAGVLVDV